MDEKPQEEKMSPIVRREGTELMMSSRDEFKAVFCPEATDLQLKVIINQLALTRMVPGMDCHIVPYDEYDKELLRKTPPIYRKIGVKYSIQVAYDYHLKRARCTNKLAWWDVEITEREISSRPIPVKGKIVIAHTDYPDHPISYVAYFDEVKNERKGSKWLVEPRHMFWKLLVARGFRVWRQTYEPSMSAVDVDIITDADADSGIASEIRGEPATEQIELGGTRSKGRVLEVAQAPKIEQPVAPPTKEPAEAAPVAPPVSETPVAPKEPEDSKETRTECVRKAFTEWDSTGIFKAEAKRKAIVAKASGRLAAELNENIGQFHTLSTEQFGLFMDVLAALLQEEVAKTNQAAPTLRNPEPTPPPAPEVPEQAPAAEPEEEDRDARVAEVFDEAGQEFAKAIVRAGIVKQILQQEFNLKPQQMSKMNSDDFKRFLGVLKEQVGK
jgi:hypothetical protein